MAILTCALCEQPIERPIPRASRVFCCHACLQLFELLGAEEVERLKRQPGIRFDVLNQVPVCDTSESLSSADSPQMLKLSLSGVFCPSCCTLIQHVLSRRAGILSVKTDYVQSTAEVLYDALRVDDAAIATEIEKLGYPVTQRVIANEADEVNVLDLRKRLALALVLTFFMMMLSIPVWSGDLALFTKPLAQALSYGLLALAIPTVFYSGWPFLRGAWTSISRGVPTMDLLVSIGSLSAFVYSLVSLRLSGDYLYFDTAGLLITFLLLSRVLEAGAKQRALAVLKMVQRLLPIEARRVQGVSEEWVAVERLCEREHVLIRSGEIIPVDGRILSGVSEVDEAILTGESKRVSKEVRDLVYAGTTHYGADLVIEVVRATETLLSQSADYVRRAQASASNWNRLAQRIVAIFVPVVLALGVTTFIYWFFVAHLTPTLAWLRAISVLVIGCPCALSIATPVALLSGAQALSKHGILLRSQDAMERARKITCVLFDKTGTLTTGRMTVIDDLSVNVSGLQEQRLAAAVSVDRAPSASWLSLAASAEYPAKHPIADALLRFAREKACELYPVESFEEVTGWGVHATVLCHSVKIGATPLGCPLSRQLRGKRDQFEAMGATVSYVIINEEVKAILALGSEIRPEAFSVLDTLKRDGYTVYLASGDHPKAVEHIADRLGITRWHARQTPLAKAKLVTALKEKGAQVCFVGDGVNDAPALIEADLGIAMGASADLALEAGHMILADNTLRALPHTLDIVRATALVIRQNLVWALGYNLIAQAMAISGYAQPVLAAGAMVLSSLFVLGNSLRIVGFSPWRYVRRVGLAFGVASILALLVYFRL
ncbi:heavy metal translocating P-type ATPase [Ferroacidibacillus organovorans]|uniref:P-type Cu(+) transporter n=1 Tax=Ferroacidibacillus organovorans TaxID=1765683 RepID=A0A124IVU9_9BACL|nr:cation-translocating P-type ATPase [Ferroacidibacillus organovorans]KUO95359.1 hypothetical protein ATW55_10910 [Ferroacidibacillus organovorans]